MKHFLVFSSVLLSLAPSARAAGSPADAAAVSAVVKGAVDGTVEVLRDKSNDRESRRKKIFSLIDAAVDFPLMGKLALGRAHWGQFEPNQQKDFISAFNKVVKDSVFDKVEIYTNETVAYHEPEPEANGKYQMLVDVMSKGQPHKAVFKLYKEAAGWKVYDLEADGISMVRIYASQYDQVLQAGKPADLIAKLKNKALAVPDQFKAIGTQANGKK
jgi:phospholipid transport system substrate-binding protein